MSTETPSQQIPNHQLQRERIRLSKILEELGRLSETDLPPHRYYADVLQALVDALKAFGGVIWGLNPQGVPQLLHQINLNQVGVAGSKDAILAHSAVLQSALTNLQPASYRPGESKGSDNPNGIAPTNPTNHLLLIVPILIAGQAAGLIEIWQNPNRSPDATQGFLEYMRRVADSVSRYLRNQRSGQLVYQQQLWSQLEAFARKVHTSLNPIEVAYEVANEGKRLIECDRLSVGLRIGRRVNIEAVSGTDVVEKRSTQISYLRQLCEGVVQWDEKLIFHGAKDESLPPRILDSLDNYLAESESKLLVVLPLKDPRDEKKKQTARSVLVMECFEPPEDHNQLVERLEVVGKHAASSLYNAAEYRRIPFRFLWLPLAKVQDGLGGRGKAIMLIICLALTMFAAAMWLVPYSLKMDATGQIVPSVRRSMYTKTSGTVEEFTVGPGDIVPEGHDLARLHDNELAKELRRLDQEFINAEREAVAASQAYKDEKNPVEKARLQTQKERAERVRDAKFAEREALIERTNADRHNFGYFFLRAPEFNHEELALFSPSLTEGRNYRTWTVLNGSFREEWTNRGVNPSEPILRLGAKDGPWEIELRIPQKHIGKVLDAYQMLNTDKLDVDYKLQTHPTLVFKGKLPRARIAGQANVTQEDPEQAEPHVIAYVQIDDPDIEEEYRLPRQMLQGGTVSGAEVHAKIRCGKHRMGYSLFYGVWEFFHEKVIFPF